MSLTYSNVLNVNKKNYNGVTIEERALSGKINIRGKSSDKEFMKGIGSVLNLVLPIEPNVRIFNNNISIKFKHADIPKSIILVYTGINITAIAVNKKLQ